MATAFLGGDLSIPPRRTRGASLKRAIFGAQSIGEAAFPPAERGGLIEASLSGTAW